MGIVFEDDGSDGMVVAEILAEGSASSTSLTPGDRLLSVNGKELAGLGFDASMDLIVTSPKKVSLLFSRIVTEVQEKKDGVTEVPEKKDSVTSIEVQDGKSTVSVQVVGDKILRTALIENKVELYDFFGKISNCGGVGQCGTCVVDIVSCDVFPLNDRTPVEEKFLRNRKNSCRLACQTVVREGSKLKVISKPSK